MDAGYPLPLTAWNLPAPFTSGVDSVVPWPSGKLAFIRGDQMVLYNWLDGSVGPYPACFYRVAGPRRARREPTWRALLYATIDPKPTFFPDDHTPNLSGLWQAVLTHPPTPGFPMVYVDRWWGPDVTSAMLADPHVMAVFSSGSHAEWYTMHPEPCSNVRPDSMCHPPETFPTWREQIEGYVGRLWRSGAPFLAVCGSHQLISGARAGWQSVGHMGEPGHTVADELLNGYSRIPCFRQSEREVKPIVLEVPS